MPGWTKTLRGQFSCMGEELVGGSEKETEKGRAKERLEEWGRKFWTQSGIRVIKTRAEERKESDVLKKKQEKQQRMEEEYEERKKDITK
ncbi:hypothetical protein Pmani_036223 [Petrolisthes manimaculis]|uniref:Uncharacterized protein n=1 Tax=Petrolisthes manimaculis TaxID=1843537 RepID=A0AAE1TMW6_9EUCA|nr:hypothetical protein Pmani_036223 [Petrolisthes manimaculis]